MKEQLEQYVKRVKELHEFCRGNEEATKHSLIAPLFGMLGYDMSDPRECRPQYKVDFGKDRRSTKPIDWAFALNGTFIFFVEAKEVGQKKLASYAEQLGDYFAKEPLVKLGILTNGIEWKFFTDLINGNVMDKEAFLTWDVLNDDAALPLDLLTILQKAQFNPQLIKTFAERKHHQNLLVGELTRLLEPSPEFIRLAVKNIETRNLTDKLLETWKPILRNALHEWAKQQALTMALQRPTSFPPTTESTESTGPTKTKKVGKTCPVCSAIVGPRTKQCECGHVFVSKSAVESAEVNSDETIVPQSDSITPT